MEPIEWLRKKAPEFSKLKEEELAAIMHFTLLWSFFEAKVLNTHACASSIIEVSKRRENEHRLNSDHFSSFLSYFKNRYFQYGVFTEDFVDLSFKQNDHKPLVEAVLKGDTENGVDISAALLIIAYRLRNNLFHGPKWTNAIQGQLDNFNNASSLLMQALEINDRF